MMNETTLKTIIAAAGGFLAYYLGGFNSLLTALITLIVIDYITGITAAWYEKKLNSYAGLRGIVKKVMMLFLSLIHI